MKRSAFVIISLLALALLLAAGCDKERIVESTEYIETTEYVTLPPDTVIRHDTVIMNDSVTINITDTVLIHDTVAQTTYVYDTVIQVNYVHDTVVTVQHDTVRVVIIDTVTTTSFEPSDPTALAALQYHTNPLVLEFINAEFGYTDGWIFYLAGLQSDLAQVSATTYDIYGFIDYWTPDWSGYYPLEYYYRVVYNGGDPANPDNWQMTEPPTASPAHQPGVNLVPNPSVSQRSLAK